MCQCKMWRLGVFLACFQIYSVITFNVDNHNYAFYNGPDKSMFGFSVALHEEGNNGWLIVGAPKAQSIYQEGVNHGGAVYRCRTDKDDSYEEIPFDTKGHNEDPQTHEVIDNKTEQWFGATVSSAGKKEGPIVACAPRYTWSSNKHRKDPVGTCFVSNGFNHSNEYSPCRTSQWGYHRQGSCQAGFSAAINRNGDRLFIGSPGSLYWQGQMFSIDAHAEFPFKPSSVDATYGQDGQVHQKSLETRPAVFSTNASAQKDDDSYMGYSTIVGDFLGNGEEGIAVGMPRGNHVKGRVLLFTWNLTKILPEFTSNQIGSYFGYALAASDVDGDGKVDLIIGAPMHTVQNDEGKYDVGRVYVIYQGDDKKFAKRYIIDGFKSKSRFGQALASLGDINQDGCEDFAVGAPYDGERGAVYIYHGSKTGVRDKYSQVIFAEDVIPSLPTGLQSSLATFGFSITGGLDLDGNQYPDMAVGAYLSNAAFFFRSRPVIRVEAYLKFLTKNKEINITDTNHVLVALNNAKATVTNLQFCIKYSGKGIPDSIDLDLQYILDFKKLMTPRMGFVDSEGQHIRNETIRVVKEQDYDCKPPQRVYVKSDIEDKLTALVAEVKYWMKDNDGSRHQDRSPRSTLSPVLDLNSPPSQTDSIYIRYT